MVVMHAFIEMNYSDQFDHNLAKKTKHFYFQFMKCLESQYKLIEGYEVV